MPQHNGVGYSNQYSPIKQAQFRIVIGTFLGMVKGIFKRWGPGRFQYWDLMAGTGQSPDRSKPGSAAIFVEEALRLGVPFDAYLFEQNLHRFHDLSALLGHRDNVSCFQGLHQDNVGMTLSGKNHRARYGMIYVDPNGGVSDTSAINEIITAPGYDRVDVLIHVAANDGYKRGKTKPIGERIDGVLDSIKKKTWLIREPYTAHQWTMLVGTDYPAFDRWKTHGFFPVDSEQGQEWFFKLNYTAAEQKRYINRPEAIGVIQNLPGVPCPSPVPGGAKEGDGEGQLDLPNLP